MPAWVAREPVHTYDANRAEDALAGTFESVEMHGQLRDWNEEYQGCVELPHASLQEALLRDRALVKVPPHSA